MSTWLPETELCKLATKHGTDKWNWHHYTPVYHRLLGDRRNDVKRVLEIGIGDPSSMADPTGKPYVPGASMRMWAEYFPNAKIFAWDNNSSLFFDTDRIHSMFCDQSSDQSIKDAAIISGGDFDLIVDDGSHVPEHQVRTANILVPYLAPNGIYVIEDVWPYPSKVGWCDGPFGTKLEDIRFKSEIIWGEGNNDDHLVLVSR